MRTLYEPPNEAITLTGIFHALSDPVRLEMLHEIAGAGETPCGTLKPEMPRSTISHHLKVLREAGLTRGRTDGTLRFVSLRRKDLERRFPGLLKTILKVSEEGWGAS
ncbi:MAG TPA: metalloregulator ArsR/SmtB family transcription factor [Candidatus Dormibacteraeota bacterium]|nr:metalloregulator ArsR/SmtB family transcription factor [Candidatus Dormibacteraeota bacterium]